MNKLSKNYFSVRYFRIENNRKNIAKKRNEEFKMRKKTKSEKFV